MTPFETGAGFSMQWFHLVMVALSGTLLIIAAVVCIVSLVLQLSDPKYLFHFGVVMKIVLLVALVALMIGVIGSM